MKEADSSLAVGQEQVEHPTRGGTPLLGAKPAPAGGPLSDRKDGVERGPLSEQGTLDLQARAERLARQYPACEPLLTLLARCGGHLAEVLTGECEPLELLCFDDDFAALEA